MRIIFGDSGKCCTNSCYIHFKCDFLIWRNISQCSTIIEKKCKYFRIQCNSKQIFYTFNIMQKEKKMEPLTPFNRMVALNIQTKIEDI